MKAFSRLLTLGAMGLILGTIVALPAAAVIPELSYLPVEEPLDVGGTVLQPGVYVIKVLPSISNRNILQVTNEDQTQVFATVLSVPHPLPPTEELKDTKFIFYPASNGLPRALRTWFNPDSTSDGGHDIVYPERRAMQIALAAQTPVVAYPDETTAEELKTTRLEVVTPEQKIAEYVEPPTEKVVAMSEGAELPRTAGNGPLLVVLGFLLVTVAASVRALRGA